MPELPEVETTMRGLEPAICGNIISAVTLNRPNLRIPFPRDFEQTLQNKKIVALRRRAKYIIAQVDGAPDLIIHLGMSGSLKVIDPKEEYTPIKHDHVVWVFKDGVRLVYNDPRRFGMIFFVPPSEHETHKSFKHLGPEPLNEEFNAKYLHDMINPTKAAGKISRAKMEVLVDEIKKVLIRAIEAGGSSLKDYKKTDGSLGYFQHNFLVYNQAGKPCSNEQCDGIIKRIVQSGRSTFYCPKEQK